MQGLEDSVVKSLIHLSDAMQNSKAEMLLPSLDTPLYHAKRQYTDEKLYRLAKTPSTTSRSILKP
jgi:hypothetical protein